MLARSRWRRPIEAVGFAASMVACVVTACAPVHGARGSYLPVMPPEARPPIAGANGEATALWGTASESARGDGIAENRRADLEALVRRFAPTIVLPPKDFAVRNGRRYRLFPINAALLADTLRVDVANAVPYGLQTTHDIALATMPLDSLACMMDRYLRYETDPAIMTTLYFDFPGGNPKQWWRHYGDLRSGPDSARWARPTVYGHPFVDPGGRLVIQYWYLYPFNDFVGNHEGDWEHVNVVPTADSSAVAEVHYYFHHRSTILPRGDFAPEIVDGTHPVVHVGGQMYHVLDHPIRWLLGERNEGSHGQFPFAGEWENVAGLTAPESVTASRDSTRVVSHDRFDVILMPEPTRIEYHRHPAVLREWAWFLLPVRWGFPLVPSFGWELRSMDVGNRAPYGPSYHVAWNRNAPGHVYADYHVRRVGWARGLIEDLLQPWYYPYLFRRPRYVHDPGAGISRRELAQLGLAPRAGHRERGVGSPILGASVLFPAGDIGDAYGRSTGISLYRNLWIKGRWGYLEMSGGYQKFPRTDGFGGSLFVYPFTAGFSMRAPDALFRPYAGAGAGIFGWESRVRQQNKDQVIRSGWNPGWTGSLGVEYYLRPHVALDVAFRYHAALPVSLAGDDPARPIRLSGISIGHYVRF